MKTNGQGPAKSGGDVIEVVLGESRPNMQARPFDVFIFQVTLLGGFGGFRGTWTGVLGRGLLLMLSSVLMVACSKFHRKHYFRPATLLADESGLYYRCGGFLGTRRFARWSGVSLIEDGPIFGLHDSGPVQGPILRINSNRYLFKLDLGRVLEPDRARLLKFIGARMGRTDPPIQPSHSAPRNSARKPSPVAVQPVDHPLWDEDMDGG